VVGVCPSVAWIRSDRARASHILALLRWTLSAEIGTTAALSVLALERPVSKIQSCTAGQISWLVEPTLCPGAAVLRCLCALCTPSSCQFAGTRPASSPTPLKPHPPRSSLRPGASELSQFLPFHWKIRDRGKWGPSVEPKGREKVLSVIHCPSSPSNSMPRFPAYQKPELIML
jgi:hypothetical protein